jgi:hypothetical protein
MVIPATKGRKGFQIRTEDGRILPKVYPTRKAAQDQIDRMERFAMQRAKLRSKGGVKSGR